MLKLEGIAGDVKGSRKTAIMNGELVRENYKAGEVLKNILPKLKPEDVIAEIKKSSMSGRGGAGF